MAVYKFRVTFEDYDDVSRDIELKATQTFHDLNMAILHAIKVETPRPASLFMSDDKWKKGKEITSQPREGQQIAQMDKSRLCDSIIDPHQKIYYIFDNEANWTFFVELIKISKEENGADYPRLVKSVGDAPKQKGTSNLGRASSEFDFLNQEAVDEGEPVEGEVDGEEGDVVGTGESDGEEEMMDDDHG